MVKLCETIAVSPEEMRHAYCNALIEAAKKDPRIVSLDCDLSSSCGTTPRDVYVSVGSNAFWCR